MSSASQNEIGAGTRATIGRRGSAGVVPGVELNRVAATGGESPDRLLQGLAIEVDRDKRRTLEQSSFNRSSEGCCPRASFRRSGLLRDVKGWQRRGSKLLQSLCRFFPLDSIGRIQEPDQLRRAGLVAEGRSRDDREGEDSHRVASSRHGDVTEFERNVGECPDHPVVAEPGRTGLVHVFPDHEAQPRVPVRARAAAAGTRSARCHRHRRSRHGGSPGTGAETRRPCRRDRRANQTDRG